MRKGSRARTCLHPALLHERAGDGRQVIRVNPERLANALCSRGRGEGLGGGEGRGEVWWEKEQRKVSGRNEEGKRREEDKERFECGKRGGRVRGVEGERGWRGSKRRIY